MTYFYIFSSNIPGMSEVPTSMLKPGATVFRVESASADEIRKMSETGELIPCKGMRMDHWVPQSILRYFGITVATATPSRELEPGDSLVVAEIIGVPFDAFASITTEDREFWEEVIITSTIFKIFTMEG